MARKNQSRLVSGLMLPWKKEKGVHRLDAPVYRFSYGTIFGEPLFSAEASTYVTNKGHELIVEVHTWDENEGQVSIQKEYVLRGDLEEEELLALASEMTFEVIADFYHDFIHAAIAR
jgi:hypothetical protein